MSDDELQTHIDDMHSIAKEHESFGSQIEMWNAMFLSDCAEAELEDRQLKQADQEVEDFMEAQANRRDHEYEVETMLGWNPQ